MTTTVWCELAVVGGRTESSVRLEIEAGRFRSVDIGIEPGEAHRLAGLTVPGLANAHSHAFHRALRSRTQAGRGTFWTWRELMYEAAARLEPDSYHRLARAAFAEMAMAGITCVGEFHYLHHRHDGAPYDDPNEMGRALIAAADDAGIRITLLDTLYLRGGIGTDGYLAPTGAQRRFTDRTAGAWAERVDALTPTATAHVGGAIHSVRAVDPDSMAVVADWASDADTPLHAHVSEQVAENDACLALHGRTPIALLADAGALSTRFSAVHATHVDTGDVDALASSGSMVVMCPTTERDLGDGIGPTGVFADHHVPMTLGTDSHAVVDLFEEARALELDERLRSERRGVHSTTELLSMATTNGHRSLGWSDAGSISVGNRADLVTVALDSVRTAGANCEHAVEAAIFAATSADVTDVLVDGRQIVAERRHRSVDVARELDGSIRELLDDV